jgi:hypothetical protein
MVVVVALAAAFVPVVAVPSMAAWVITFEDGKELEPSLLLLLVAVVLLHPVGAGGTLPLAFVEVLQVSVKVPPVPSL